jgi:hypothetical protein
MIATTARSPDPVITPWTSRPLSDNWHKRTASEASRQRQRGPGTIADGTCTTCAFPRAIHDLRSGLLDKPDSTGAS